MIERTAFAIGHLHAEFSRRIGRTADASLAEQVLSCAVHGCNRPSADWGWQMINSSVAAFLGAAVLACVAADPARASCKTVMVPWCDGGYEPPLDFDAPFHLCGHWTKVARTVCNGDEYLSKEPTTTHVQGRPTGTTLEKDYPHRVVRRP